MGQSRGQRQQVKAQVTLRSEITNSLVLILMGVGSLSCEPYIIASFFWDASFYCLSIKEFVFVIHSPTAMSLLFITLVS